MGKKGTLFLVSGFSGVGKNTVLKQVMEKLDNIRFSVSCTSRQPRDYEVNDVDYHFISVDDFEKKISNGEFLEYTKTFTNYYGTLKSEVYDYIEKGIDVILEINVVGTKNVKKIDSNSVSIFIAPPSIDELKKRLYGRGTEDQESINKRLAEIDFETNEMKNYDYIVVNDVVESCAAKVIEIIKKTR